MARSGVVNVFVEKITPRIQWVLGIFEDILGTEVFLFTDVDDFTHAESPALNYSIHDIPNVPKIIPAGILTETDIRQQDIKISNENGHLVFFQTEGGALGYDPFAMAFFLVSRYEEYLPFTADQHARFPHTESLAYEKDFLDIPLVNHLVQRIKELLLRHYPDMEFKEPEYSFLPTVDIDIAYAHLGKGFLRTYGAMAKLLLKGNLYEIKQRMRSMQGKSADPFDNFDFLNKAFKQHNLKPIYFILAGDPGPHDRNLSVNHKKVAALLCGLSENADIGVHPSYRSGDDPARVKTEIDRIGKTIGHDISQSRQHYVRMKFPDTYRILIENGIKDDYSMGYASISGFRASIASPFNFYDLEADMETELRIHPFMFMDSTLDDYMHLDPVDYLSSVIPIIEEVKAIKGNLCGIWHNYAMADDKAKKQAFLDILKLASES